MLPSHIGNRDPGTRRFLQDPQLLVDGIPSTALNTRINLNTLCIRRHSRITRLTPSSYLRQQCPVEMGAAPVSEAKDFFEEYLKETTGYENAQEWLKDQLEEMGRTLVDNTCGTMSNGKTVAPAPCGVPARD